MSWSYEPDKLDFNKKDQVRLMIGDTDPDDPLLNDAEIEFFLRESGDVVLDAAVKAVSAIIARLAGEVDFRVGPYQESNTGRLDRLRLLYRQLKAQQPGMTILMKTPTTPPIFRYEFLGTGGHIEDLNEA